MPTRSLKFEPKEGLIMKRIIIILVVTCVISFLLGLIYGYSEKINTKQTAEQPVVTPRVKKPVMEIKNFDLLEEIKKAKEILEDEDAGFYLADVPMFSKEKKGKGKKARTVIHRWKVQKLEDFNVLLAVEKIDRQDREIEFVKLEGKKKKSPRGFSVDFKKLNGVNTPYNVKFPSGYVVLGLKQVVQMGKDYEEKVYTPYTKEIDTPEMRLAGLTYLREQISIAEYDLRLRGVKSKAFGCLVADAVPTEVSLVLSIIEHVEPSRLSKTPIDQLIGEVLVTVAANPETAYQYSVSKAGARSLFQFIPRTYKNVDRLYPNAGLHMDFVGGMNNHRNGAKASLLLFDSDLSYLSKEYRGSLKSNPELMGKYLAAAYNGGAGRAARAMKAHGKNWENKVLPETVMYLKKFGAVWKALNI